MSPTLSRAHVLRILLFVTHRLVALCTHKNRKVQYAAFPALKVFFKQVAGELVSGNRSFESNKETFKVPCSTDRSRPRSRTHSPQSHTSIGYSSS
jgi:hypothetical protein